MSHKNDMRVEIKNIIKKGDNIEITIDNFIKNEYRHIIEDYKKTGQSIEGITYEILEAIEYNLQNDTKKSKEILKKSSDMIVEIAELSARNSIDESYNLVNKYKQEFNKEIDDFNSDINKKNSIFKNKIEKLHHRFYNNIEHEKFHLFEVMDGISIYGKDKSYKFFEDSIKKGKDAIAYIDIMAKKYKKSIRHYSKIKFANFFYKLANRINKI